MYTIKHASELTGVPVATLRAWERRYDVVAPARTASGYRVYDEAALRAITAMHALVESGWSPRQAAEEVRSRGSAAGVENGSAQAAPADWSPTASAAEFVEAARRLDAAQLDAVLDQAFARGSFELVVDSWLMPALQGLGDAWASGRVSVAAEHLASHTVLRRLAAAFEGAGHAAGGPRVVVGLAPGSRHELGLLAFATAARRVGLNVLYVGADLPVDSWLDAVRRHDADAAVVGVPTAADARTGAHTVAALHAADPELQVFAGGGQQELVSPAAQPLGHHVAAAARLLAAVLRGSREQASTS